MSSRHHMKAALLEEVPGAENIDAIVAQESFGRGIAVEDEVVDVRRTRPLVEAIRALYDLRHLSCRLVGIIGRTSSMVSPLEGGRLRARPENHRHCGTGQSEVQSPDLGRREPDHVQ